MKTNNNIPAYRFQGYTDAWELRKLGEITEKQFGGGTPTTSNALFWEGNIPWIQSSDLEEGIFSVGPRKYITKDGLGNSSAQLIPKNSIAIVTRVGVGKLAFMPFTYTTSQGFLSISYLKTNELFTIYSLYIKLQNEIKVLQGTSIKGITKNELLIKEIPIPSLPEQEAIGTFFSTLDRQITLHQRKLDTLKEQKKTYLKLLFPSKGQTKPALRFQGFEDDWEEVKLGEVLSVSKLKNKENEYSKLNVLSVSREQGTVNQIEYQGRSFASDDVSGYKIVNVGQMIYTKSPLKGAPYGIFQTVTINGIVSPLYAVYNSSGRALASFVSLILKEDAIATHYLSPLVTKGAKNTINVTDEGALEGKVKIPTLPEQQAIGTFFQTLDREISQVEDKLASLKELKKTLLRKLFV